MDMLFCFRRHSLPCCVEFIYFLYFVILFTYLLVRANIADSYLGPTGIA